MSNELGLHEASIISMTEEMKQNDYLVVWDGSYFCLYLPKTLEERFVIPSLMGGSSKLNLRFKSVREAYAYFSGIRDTLWWTKKIPRNPD